MVYTDSFKGRPSVVLESDQLKVTVLPTIGGKIASIFNKNKNFELLFQNKNDKYEKASLYSAFENFDAAGFDDAFPTIDACSVKVGDKDIKYPDHGEIWTRNFEYRIEDPKVTLWCKSDILPYTFNKSITLDEDGIHVQYNIVNNGSDPIPCLWAMHCLVNCEKGMKILLPKGTTEVQNAQESKALGEVGHIHPFPLSKDMDGHEIRLDEVLPATACNTEKYYVNGRVKSGDCGIYYPKEDITYRIHFDKEKTPYLGFWVTEGGFRGDYNCALEPSNGYYDSVKIARKNDSLYTMEPNSSLDFDINIQLS